MTASRVYDLLHQRLIAFIRDVSGGLVVAAAAAAILLCTFQDAGHPRPDAGGLLTS